MGWIGVDLDGTLAEYDGWKGIDHIGTPIPKMLQRVKDWIKDGKTVKIMTARVHPNQDRRKLEVTKYWIAKWCLEYIGEELEITCEKDMEMEELWDDRCIQVVPNTGERVDGKE